MAKHRIEVRASPQCIVRGCELRIADEHVDNICSDFAALFGNIA